MSTTAPLLSICIPTHNRAPLLRQTLESIVVQAPFQEGHAIEVIVSDNCSSDDTPAVVAPFLSAYPDKIFYQRHDPGIRADENFATVLNRARGDFLKLQNDSLTFRNGSLAEMLRVIDTTRSERPVIFFTNGNQHRGVPIETVDNLSDFVRRASIYSTWIGGFGIWREDLLAMPDFARNEPLLLLQTDVLFRLMAGGKRAVLLFEPYFALLNVGRKGGYNVAKVFGNNYLTLLKEYLGTGQLDPAAYAAEKREALVQMVLPYYFDANHDFQRTGFFVHLHDYLNEPYFPEELQKLAAKGIQIPVPPMPADAPANASAAAPQLDRMGILNAYWRERNADNDTWLARVPACFDPDAIVVGRKSHGALSVVPEGRSGGRLAIGRFVSIAPDVTFVTDGAQAHDGFSTYPFGQRYFDAQGGAGASAITIGDDVRIGFGATIMKGITIGQGAVIAAGSVVADDVPPYALVAGNPARVTGLRYEQEVVDKMSAFDFSVLSDAVITANRDLLEAPLTPANVDAVLARLRG